MHSLQVHVWSSYTQSVNEWASYVAWKCLINSKRTSNNKVNFKLVTNDRIMIYGLTDTISYNSPQSLKNDYDPIQHSKCNQCFSSVIISEVYSKWEKDQNGKEMKTLTIPHLINDPPIIIIT